MDKFLMQKFLWDVIYKKTLKACLAKGKPYIKASLIAKRYTDFCFTGGRLKDQDPASLH